MQDFFLTDLYNIKNRAVSTPQINNKGRQIYMAYALFPKVTDLTNQTVILMSTSFKNIYYIIKVNNPGYKAMAVTVGLSIANS